MKIEEKLAISRQFLFFVTMFCYKGYRGPYKGWGTTPSKFWGIGLPWNWFVVVKEPQQTFNSVSCNLHYNK
jgi:hypothetical protein